MGNIFGRAAKVVQDDRQQLSVVNAGPDQDPLLVSLSRDLDLLVASVLNSPPLEVSSFFFRKVPSLEFCDDAQTQEDGRVIPDLPIKMLLIIIRVSVEAKNYVMLNRIRGSCQRFRYEVDLLINLKMIGLLQTPTKRLNSNQMDMCFKKQEEYRVNGLFAGNLFDPELIRHINLVDLPVLPVQQDNPLHHEGTFTPDGELMNNGFVMC